MSTSKIHSTTSVEDINNTINSNGRISKTMHLKEAKRDDTYDGPEWNVEQQKIRKFQLFSTGVETWPCPGPYSAKCLRWHVGNGMDVHRSFGICSASSGRSER